jgi:hypothetical protein
MFNLNSNTMKKQFKFFAMASLLLYLLGCDTDSTMEEVPSEDSFKLFTLINDQDGNYLLQQVLADGKNSEVFFKNGVYTLQMLAEDADKTIQETPLQLLENELKIDIIAQDDEKISVISVIDENKNTQKKSSFKISEYLIGYKLSQLVDRSYLIEFEVPKDIVARFEFNKKLQRHEIWVGAGNNDGTTSHVKNFLKLEDTPLNIIFVYDLKKTTLKQKNNEVYDERYGPPYFILT